MAEKMPRPITTDQVYLAAIYDKLCDIDEKLNGSTASEKDITKNGVPASKKAPAKGGKK